MVLAAPAAFVQDASSGGRSPRDVGVGGSDSLASIPLGKYGVCVSQQRQLSNSERRMSLLGPHKYLFVNMGRMVGLASKIPDCDMTTKYLDRNRGVSTPRCAPTFASELS